VSLNCEQGILVTDGVLAMQLQQLFTTMTAPDSAWRVGRDAKKDLQWNDGRAVYDSDPQASLLRRMLSRVLSWLPLEREL
jgi:cardiolipin synthase C